jgi:hypothetical protein
MYTFEQLDELFLKDTYPAWLKGTRLEVFEDE